MSVSANPNKDTNILDLVLTNACDMVSSSIQVVDGIRGSDHNAVDFIIMKPLRKRKRTVYNFNKADWDLYDDLLSKVQWDSCFRSSSIDEIWCSFKETLFEITDL